MDNQIKIDSNTWVMVLTGAGVSAESGVPTFRDSNGLWENYPVEDVASPEGFRRDPALVWRFYSQRRAFGRSCSPNPGHHALKALEERLCDRFLLVTQNVDGLHKKAGSERIVELHGNLYKTRCSQCDRMPFDDVSVYAGDALPACDACAARGIKALLRPHIVWFGEMLDGANLERVNDFMSEAGSRRFVFIAAGTSGVVFPAAGMVLAARRNGGETWLVNAEPAENTRAFEHFVRGRSGEVLPSLFLFV